MFRRRAPMSATEQAAFLEVALPGARLPADLDVRTFRPMKFETSWCGDLYVGNADAPGGTEVTVGTLRGAQALAALDPAATAAIVRIHAAVDDVEAYTLLAARPWAGVRSLSLRRMPPSVEATFIRACPALEDYSCTDPAADEVLDALADSAVQSLYLSYATDRALERLGAATRLADLSLFRWRTEPGFSAAGLRCLAGYPALRELRIGHCDLSADELAAVLELGGLERLFLGNNPLDDRAASALAALPRLRTLDLHGTRVGDATAIALATLPSLEELDLAETSIGVAGIRALAAAPALRRLGLSWDVSDAITAAASALPDGVVSWNDYHSGGSALWGGGYQM